MEAMKEMPDRAFDLAIVDPPYGNKDAIGIQNSNGHAATRTDYRLFKNEAPDKAYFEELKRVSKHQIVWGGNFFGLAGGYICWDKNGTAFGEAELAWCSKINSVRVFEYTWNGMIQADMMNKEKRIHPTQKPVKLYEWLLKNFAKQGETIIDTHLGSGSIAIACDNMGFDLVAMEIDAEYFHAAKNRLEEHRKQGKLIFV
jgi:site-specific DNA-methyltransferase (adenine-specific)